MQPRFVMAVACVFSCHTPPASGELLQAVAWAQSAAEHHAACEQVYCAATAALQQTVSALPSGDRARAAVIVDIDETMLDNSPFQARLVLDQRAFSEDAWQAWVQEAVAVPIPGALAFAGRCHDNGVRVFYVTNRSQADEAATRRNLLEAGFPLDETEGIDVVLTRGDIDDSSDKTARRNFVASRHVVLITIGDDLNDFLAAASERGARDQQVTANRQLWGTRWFVVPNPMYGSWERALVAGSAPSGDAPAAKRAALDPRRAR